MSFVDDPDDPGRSGFTELLFGLRNQSKKRRRSEFWQGMFIAIVVGIVGVLWFLLLAAQVIP